MKGRQALLRLVHRTGLPDRRARQSLESGRFALMFHGVSSRKRADLSPAVQPYLAADDLEKILGWLDERCRLLTADEFLEGSQPGVLLTFDDGYANNHNIALPLLERWSAPAVFFITTQHVEDPRDWLPAIRRESAGIWASADAIPDDLSADLFDGMSVEQLKGCAETEGLEIGSHSVSHPLLTGLDDDALEQELETSRRTLEHWVGKPIRFFAYPTGDYDRRVALAARAAGYRAAFADDRRGLAPDPDFEIPRVGLYSSEPWYLAAKLSGLFRRPLPVAGAS